MKKVLKVLSFVILSSLVVFTLAACGRKTKTPTPTTKAPVATTTKAPVVTTKAPVVTTKAPVVTTKAPDVTTKAPTTTVVQVTKLDAPTVTIDDEGNASWTAVEHASGYVYKIGETELMTLNLTVKLNDGETIQVMALGEGNYSDSDYSIAQTYTAPVVIEYGYPTPEEGFYMTNPDVVQIGTDTRYLVYTTNKTKAEEDNVIAVRIGTLTENGWLYGEETIAIEPSEAGWDKYLGSASIVKGVFALGSEEYSYLMAYTGTTSADGNANQIGFAVAKTVDGDWVKVGNEPVIKYDAAQYGPNMAGCYAPSLVNYNKVSGIRVFYTYADAYGHFAYFADFDLSDLSHIDGDYAMITNAGDLSGGDAVTMFPNADFIYFSQMKKFFAVKDYSPSAATKPQFADQIELAYIEEAELYTTDEGEGWVSQLTLDYVDLECDRVYSACLISDEYGHVNPEVEEIVYTVCEEGDNYLYTQHITSFTPEYDSEP